QRSVGTRSCRNLYLWIGTAASDRKRVNMIWPVGAITVVVVGGNTPDRIVCTRRITGVHKRCSGCIVSTRNHAARTVIRSRQRHQIRAAFLMRQAKFALTLQQSPPATVHLKSFTKPGRRSRDRWSWFLGSFRPGRRQV